MMFAIHLVTNIFIQANLLAASIWYYDTSIDLFITYAGFGLVFLGVDYFINSLILNRTNVTLKHKCIVHLTDFIVAIPSLWLAFKAILQLHNYRPVEKALTASIIVLVMNALLIIERIVLIRKS